MTVFIRSARPEDGKNFADWFVETEAFDREVFQFPETYTLCAFKKSKILGYLVVHFGHGINALSRFVCNPEDSELEKALASSELVKTVISLCNLGGFKEIYFVGNNLGTNRIASHFFKEVSYDDYKHVYEESRHPVYKLILKDLE